jgi:hypothetical protein
VSTDDLQPSTAEAFTEVARAIVLVKLTSQGLQKMILADVDVARRMTWRGKLFPPSEIWLPSST